MRFRMPTVDWRAIGLSTLLLATFADLRAQPLGSCAPPEMKPSASNQSNAETARARLPAGSTLLRLRVGSTGRPNAIEIEVSSGDRERDALALKAAAGWTMRGTPVGTVMFLPMAFMEHRPPFVQSAKEDIEFSSIDEALEWLCAQPTVEGRRALTGVDYLLDGVQWRVDLLPQSAGRMLLRGAPREHRGRLVIDSAALCEGPVAACRQLIKDSYSSRWKRPRIKLVSRDKVHDQKR